MKKTRKSRKNTTEKTPDDEQLPGPDRLSLYVTGYFLVVAMREGEGANGQDRFLFENFLVTAPGPAVSSTTIASSRSTSTHDLVMTSSNVGICASLSHNPKNAQSSRGQAD